MSDTAFDFAAAGRARKVDALVAWIKADLVKQGLIVLDELPDEGWTNLCAKSGVQCDKPPSERSRELVKERIRRWIL